MSLEQFATPGGAPLFTDAQRLPEFFENNLQDPAREVKAFEGDPQANIRIFYYQYLKLCFESENVNYNQYIGKVEEIINDENFRFMFYEEADPAFYDDLTFKQLIMEFFGVLGSGKYSVEEALSVYQVMDEVFVAFMRSIMVLTGTCDNLDQYLPWRETYDFLRKYFAVEIAFHDNCLKFVDTDIFVYQDTEEEVFMAYMDFAKLERQEEAAANTNLQQSPPPSVIVQPPPQPPPAVEVQPPSPLVPAPPPAVVQPPPPSDPVVVVDPRRDSSSMRASQESGAAKSSYIESEFVDYTGGASLNGYGKEMTGSGIQNKQSTLKEMDKAQIAGSGLQSVPTAHSVKPQPEPAEPPFKVYQQPQQQQPTPAVTPPIVKTEPAYVLPIQPQPVAPQPVVTQPVVPQPTYAPPTAVQSPPSSTPIQALQQAQSLVVAHTYANQFASSSAQSGANSSWQSSQQYQPPTTAPNYQSYPSAKPAVETYKPNYQTYTPLVAPAPPPAGKNPFNLNVSQEFTNSFTMRAMAEPFKSNVVSIRQKARNYRNSLRSHI